MGNKSSAILTAERDPETEPYRTEMKNQASASSLTPEKDKGKKAVEL